MLSEGDICRGQRQLAFIKALMLKTLSKDVLTNPIKLKDFTEAATSNLTVDQNLDVGTMRSEAFAMRGLRGGDIRFITAPFSGFGTSPDGAVDRHRRQGPDERPRQGHPRGRTRVLPVTARAASTS